MASTRIVSALLPLLVVVSVNASGRGGEGPSREEAAGALRRAVRFFRERVGVEGGYVWRCSADLSKREGEGKVGRTTAWVQPPGTPFVGDAFVEIHRLTGDPEVLEAARESARLLVRGQLHSGGWPAQVELAPEDRRRFAYRVDGEPSRKARNQTSLDDDMTQSAIRFLAKYDEITNFKDESVHEAVLYALESLVSAQYPNGAWPQGYRGHATGEGRPAKRASYAEDGEYKHVKEYWDFYTLNDNVMRNCIETLLLAAEIYDKPRYREAAIRGGDFLLLAQMPEPQPAWAQQYDFDMRPTWARKFEPPAISGGESQGIVDVLLDLYDETSDEKWLEPVPKAIAYLERSLLPDGRLARFYEPETNRPLYFTRDYKLTYDDSDVPTHYSFRVESRLDRLDAKYKKLAAARGERTRGAKRTGEPAETGRSSRRSAGADRPGGAEVERVIEALDPRGAWVEEGTLRFYGNDPTNRIIDPRTFVANAVLLARYVGRSEETSEGATR